MYTFFSHNCISYPYTYRCRNTIKKISIFIELSLELSYLPPSIKFIQINSPTNIFSPVPLTSRQNNYLLLRKNSRATGAKMSFTWVSLKISLDCFRSVYFVSIIINTSQNCSRALFFFPFPFLFLLFFTFFFLTFFVLIGKINDSLCFRKFNPFEQESSRVPLLECCHTHHENCLYIMHGKSAFNFSRIHREKTRLYHCFRES